jgi:tripartite-type tricarboxylate transporter receptor subunit TctC
MTRTISRSTRRTVIAASGAVMLAAALLPAAPVRPALAAEPMRVVVGFAAGSGVDAVARLVVERARTAGGGTIIIENRPGAGGRVAADVVAHSNPDGNTLLFAPIVTTAFTPFVYKKLSFDPLKDLAPITRAGNFKFTLAVNNSVPANTVREFVAYVKANPGKVGYAPPGPGTPAHFLGAMFNKATGTDLLHVPYRGSGPAAVAILGGQVLSAINTTVAMGPLYNDKKVKLLAVTGAKRSPTLPDVPTFGELNMNLGDIESAELWYGFLTQGKTPSATVQKLNGILVEALNDPTVQARLRVMDIEVATDTPDAFAKLIQADYERWGRVIKASGFTLSD